MDLTWKKWGLHDIYLWEVFKYTFACDILIVARWASVVERMLSECVLLELNSSHVVTVLTIFYCAACFFLFPYPVALIYTIMVKNLFPSFLQTCVALHLVFIWISMTSNHFEVHMKISNRTEKSFRGLILDKKVSEHLLFLHSLWCVMWKVRWFQWPDMYNFPGRAF